MVLDFADGQVVVATFPQPEVEWGLSDAPLRALVSIVSVSVRLGAFMQNLVGLAVGPVLAGRLSNRYGLTAALAVRPLLCVVSAAMFCYRARFYERDRAAVPVVGAPAPARPQAGHP